jgi:Tfp pilus assembly protein PilF
LKPDYAGAWINLGGMFRVRGAIDKALEYYRHAHSLDPASVEINHNMGVAWHDLGRPDEAIAWYEEAQKIRPGHPDSQLNLAVALLQTGELARGWEAFECRFRVSSRVGR